MIRSIIIDDEQKSRESLKKILEEYCKDVKILAAVDSIQKGIEEINYHEPDLVFLDIEFPGNNGFDLLSKFDEIFFDIIFTTGHEQYALKAFKSAALDYLLKPIDINELENAIRKVKEKKGKQNTSKQLDVFLQNLKKENTEQIALASTEGFSFIKINQIIYCKGDGAYTYFYLTSGEKITVSKNLKEFEELLSDKGFFRTHKSYLINLSEMKKYVRGDGGYIIMSNGDNIDVSKRKKESFLNILSKV